VGWKSKTFFGDFGRKWCLRIDFFFERKWMCFARVEKLIIGCCKKVLFLYYKTRKP
jgi:hypothetical protein